MIKKVIKVYIRINLLYLKFKYLLYYLFKIRVGEYNNADHFERIGFIDQDGLCHVPLKYKRFLNVNDIYVEGDFLLRKRFSLNILILLKNDTLFVEKKFNNNFFYFYNELSILRALKDVDCVPKIYCVDYENLSFTYKYIEGFCVRERLAKLGALVRDVNKGINNSVEILNNDKIASALNSILSAELLSQIMESVNKIHNKKVLIMDIKYGNIVICNNKPYLLDFNDSILFKRTPAVIFNFIKKSDFLKFENIFSYTD